MNLNSIFDMKEFFLFPMTNFIKLLIRRNKCGLNASCVADLVLGAEYSIMNKGLKLASWRGQSAEGQEQVRVITTYSAQVAVGICKGGWVMEEVPKRQLSLIKSIRKGSQESGTSV